MCMVKYSTGIGVPACFKLSYDENTKSVKGGLGNRKLRTCLKVVSADLKLKLYFAIPSGELCGFEYKSGVLELLPETQITMPYAPDGFIKVDELCSFKLPNFSYVTLCEAYAEYDKDKKILLVGNMIDGGCTYKVCKNTSVQLDNDGNLSCFLIEL